jgi:tetratricopeptide (TPR) repeat protein
MARVDPFVRTLLPLGLALAALASTAGCGHDGVPVAQQERVQSTAPDGRPRLLEGLPPAHHPITTTSGEAQRYFDQGLILVYGFNHEAAIRSFEEALRLDPRCAMCRWGIALALGPNINRPMGPEAATRAWAESQRALEAADGATPRERAYIEALAMRYAERPPESRGGLDLAYADAMRHVHEADPSDLDAATLFAESLMDLYPWNYWTDDGEPRAHTPELLRVLEGVLERTPEHVGANHLYIHAVEEFFPEKGVPAADRLKGLAPDSGHLVHMPSHIYWRVGRYEEAADINVRAAAADERYFSWCGPDAFYRAAYYPHNVHFLWAAASAEGRRELAIGTARKLAAATRDGLDEAPFTQEFVAIPMLTLARFGEWDAVLGEPVPDEGRVYLAGISSYTRGLAHVRRGDLDRAADALAELERHGARPEAEALILAGGTSSARTLLSIGAAHLEGELAAARGDVDAAVAALERATEVHDGLAYMEPPPWYASPRLALGSLLLRMGESERAVEVYREDLEQYPRNGWALFGLQEGLAASGMDAEAAWARSGFEQAWARADLELTRSSL